MAVDGNWKLSLNTPMGPQAMKLSVKTSGETFSGRLSGPMGDHPVEGKVADNTLTWSTKITQPMPVTLEFTVTVNGDAMTGNAKLGSFGNAAVTGSRV